ncbi:MAG TPA: ATPase [Anaerolinea thermolimosa]|uniref:ATPase n=1 Tax=Anaerolinea thermolimosa TaxID=229919 RepID=A0A3D1JFW7_9CHLR|nr:ATPase [Anaerolinea thermolimosa]
MERGQLSGNLQNGQVIGYIVGGGLKENLRVRLTVPAHTVQEGAFVVTESGDWLFYGLVTDLQLGATDPRFADEQSEERLPAGMAALLHGQTLYTNLEVLPALMVHSPQVGEPLFEHPVPIKTIPAHHARVRLADLGDVAQIFGDPREKGNYVIGYTREQGHPVCIDLDKLVQRSAGIFGATGTGKSFLTRIVLAGLIYHNVAGALIFDMHNEYGPDVHDSDRNVTLPGLKSKFRSRVRLVGLGRTSDFRGVQPDFNLEIAENDIDPADIEMLTRELNLKETTPATLAALEREFGPRWFHEFKKMRYGAKVENEEGKLVDASDSVAAWAQRAGVHPAAAEGLYGKLGRVFEREYIVERPAADTVGEIIKALEAGQHVVLSFGRFETDLDYLLVANILTRRIRAAWEKKTGDYLREGKPELKPRPLVIVVEEAHKLLNREVAAQTAFSTIAREMRKYYVTLLIIDQRPSQIYDEVMSQLGTRISGWLGDDLDIQAVLSGLAGKDALRGMLARLQPKEEVLLLGWGVPMPIPVRSRRYDEQFWVELFGQRAPGKKSEAEILKELGF